MESLPVTRFYIHTHCPIQATGGSDNRTGWDPSSKVEMRHQRLQFAIIPQCDHGIPSYFRRLGTTNQNINLRPYAVQRYEDVRTGMNSPQIGKHLTHCVSAHRAFPDLQAPDIIANQCHVSTLEPGNLAARRLGVAEPNWWV
jgi:hypothetical protein